MDKIQGTIIKCECDKELTLYIQKASKIVTSDGVYLEWMCDSCAQEFRLKLRDPIIL